MIIHERTGTSRKVRDIENELAADLKHIALLIRKDPSFPNNIPMLRQKYGVEVSSTIQSAVQGAYMAGLAYVAQFEDIPALLTQQDIQNIQEKSRFEVEGFWRTVSRDTINQQVPTLIKAVNIPAAAGLIATAVAFGTLALATVDKPKQLGDNQVEAIFITAQDERVCPICRPLHGKVWRVGDPSLVHPVSGTHPNCRCRLLLRSGGRAPFSH